ncbi:MAG: hypothetical protein ONB44_23100 [candidate division KSB1 bacterium]|nr:hypothetical protein [candidate division KSB1 bacterium]MDZ7305028.1 hypothetical protein [candidate division KSB1 bacterium]MDZ7314128.1 hypothetical protein [candidate division KSB1 bacterium]
MFLNRGTSTKILLSILFLVAIQAHSDNREKNKWFDIKVKTTALKTKFFDAFIAIPKNADSLHVLYAAVPRENVWYSPDGYGQRWIPTTGLEAIKVNKFVVHPMSNDTVYACTSSGLYTLAVGRLQWTEVGREWKYSSMISVTFGQPPDNSIYAATLDSIFKLSHRDSVWKSLGLLPDTSKTTRFGNAITAITLSPFSAKHFVVGTNQGVYSVEIKNDSLVSPSKLRLGSPKELNSYAFFRNKSGGIEILALTRNEGAFYSPDSIDWWPMNTELKKSRHSFPYFQSLTIDHGSVTRSCYAASLDGKIKQYRLVGLQVGFIKSFPVYISTWENDLILNRLFQHLSDPEIIELFQIGNITINSKSGLDTLLKENKELRSYDKLVWPKVTNISTSDTLRESRNINIVRKSRSISIEIYVYTRKLDGSFVESKPYNGEKDSEKYYPTMVDSLARQIKLKEFGIREHSMISKCFWLGWRKYILGGLILAAGIHAIAAMVDSDKRLLPMPPQFP